MTSAWGLVPEDLAALGYPRDGAALFGRLTRVDAWGPDGPVLSRAGRSLVDRHGISLELPTIRDVIESDDESRRVVIELKDGARVEAVVMPRPNGRVTICLSSQVGCAMGCSFCATARMGLVRNMAAHEIIGQLLAILRRFGPSPACERVNLVFMGMGEPLANVDAILRVLDIACDPRGLNLAPRRITVSTAGHVAGLDRLATSKHLPELAISVNGMGTKRRSLMPIDKRWSLVDLARALDRWPQAPHRKLTIEYVLLHGINDDAEHATELARWVRGIRHRSVVNLIPFNRWEGAPYEEPPAATIEAFAARVRDEGCLVKVRRSRGRDARAACGTLTRMDRRPGS